MSLAAPDSLGLSDNAVTSTNLDMLLQAMPVANRAGFRYIWVDAIGISRLVAARFAAAHWNVVGSFDSGLDPLRTLTSPDGGRHFEITL